MNHLLDPAIAATLPDWLGQHGQAAYRAGQIRQWLFDQRAESFDEMSNLPKELREQLAAEFTIWTMTVDRHHHASDGTEKLLLRLHDGHHIECVLLRDGGAADDLHQLASRLCDGLRVLRQRLGWGRAKSHGRRNCRANVAARPAVARRGAAEPHRRDGHGGTAGEPRSPAAGAWRSDQLRPAWASAIAASRFPLSACRRQSIGFRELDARFQLAVSLHAPDDQLRNELVPVNKNIGLDAIIAAADRYFEVSGRRLTFEYVLLGGLNDQPQHAHKLSKLLHGRLALVNLIPYNSVAGLPYEAPSKKNVERFVEILTRAGLNVQIRERKGDEINAACGQLRRSLIATRISSPLMGEEV